MSSALERVLTEAGLAGPVVAERSLGGGCIHRVSCLTLASGQRVVAKRNDRRLLNVFEEEAAGLAALAATDTVLVPRPLTVGVVDNDAVLLLEWIEPDTGADGWSSFGRELAALHAHDAGRRYGFDMDNHLGATPQPNAWDESWVEFNRRHRLGHQLDLSLRDARLDRSEARRIEQLMSRLGDFLPDAPHPALLHGDLWSGNALASRDCSGAPRIAVIDPAPYVGDGWADIAMMQLFGGFAPAAYESYAAAVDDHDGIDRRIAIYQLYHVLNHVNLFGRGYAGQAMSIVGRLGF